MILCQTCLKRPAKYRTKKRPALRSRSDHDVCGTCERRMWDRRRLAESNEEDILEQEKEQDELLSKR